jgi:hypothetical protein
MSKAIGKSVAMQLSLSAMQELCGQPAAMLGLR